MLGTASSTAEWGPKDIAWEPIIQLDQHDQLLFPPTRQEIKQALWEIPDQKAPGADGYESQFFKDSRDITGESDCKALIEFLLVVRS